MKKKLFIKAFSSLFLAMGLLICQLSNAQTNSLIGQWQLLNLHDNHTDSLHLPNKQLLFEFQPDNRILYTLDVNTCMSEYKIIEKKIIISPSARGCTKICCDKPNPILFYRNLKDTISFSISNDILTMIATSDILKFKKK